MSPSPTTRLVTQYVRGGFDLEKDLTISSVQESLSTSECGSFSSGSVGTDVESYETRGGGDDSLSINPWCRDTEVNRLVSLCVADLDPLSHSRPQSPQVDSLSVSNGDRDSEGWYGPQGLSKTQESRSEEVSPSCRLRSWCSCVPQCEG